MTRTCPSPSCLGWNAFLPSVCHQTQPTITVEHVLLSLTRSHLCILLVVGRCVLCVPSWEWSVSGGAVGLTRRRGRRTEIPPLAPTRAKPKPDVTCVPATPQPVLEMTRADVHSVPRKSGGPASSGVSGSRSPRPAGGRCLLREAPGLVVICCTVPRTHTQHRHLQGSCVPPHFPSVVLIM